MAGGGNFSPSIARLAAPANYTRTETARTPPESVTTLSRFRTTGPSALQQTRRSVWRAIRGKFLLRLLHHDRFYRGLWQAPLHSPGLEQLPLHGFRNVTRVDVDVLTVPLVALGSSADCHFDFCDVRQVAACIRPRVPMPTQIGARLLVHDIHDSPSFSTTCPGRDRAGTTCSLWNTPEWIRRGCRWR